MHDFASAGVADPSAVSPTEGMAMMSGLPLQSALTFGWF